MENTQGKPFYLKLHWQVLAAMVLGALIGHFWGPGAESIKWIGSLFIRLLKMIIVPLVLASIISGVASIASGRAVGRLFGKTLGYYVLTSLLAASTGLLMVNLIRPGDDPSVMEEAATQALPEGLAVPGWQETVMDIVPENVFAAAAGAGNMLQIIFFSIVLGLAIATLPNAKARKTLTELIDSFFQAMIKLTMGIIKLLPIAVLCLIARLVGETGTDQIANFAKYVGTLASGLAFHFLITLPLVLWVLGRISPLIHFRNMINPIVVAFSTSSSAATLPVTMRTVEERVGVSKKVSSFVLPMGATVNMDGTAVFECVGALFIAQLLGFELTLGMQAIAVGTAMLASIGAAAVPSAGLVVIFIVLEAIGLGNHPGTEAIVAAMLAIDRPLDMCRTAVNVFSDSCGAAIIARSEGETEVDTEVR